MCHLANELTIHPDIQKRLQKEIDSAFKENNGKLTYENIMKMKYLDMVVSENLRKWATNLMSDRVCTRDYTIESNDPNEPTLELKKGDVIGIPIYSIHMDPNYYPNPKKFDPERFNDENKVNINPSSYLPFGAGPRNCIGRYIILFNSKYILLKNLSFIIN